MNELDVLSTSIQAMPCDCLYKAASIVYVRVHSINVQEKIENLWTSQISTKKSSLFTLTSFLSSENEIDEWAKKIDTSNTTLIDNLLAIRGVIQSSNKCWPLIHDPFHVVENYVALLEEQKYTNLSTHSISSKSSELQFDDNVVIVNASDSDLGA